MRVDDKTLDFYQRLGLTLLRTSGPDADGVRSAVIQVGSQELNLFCDPPIERRDGTSRSRTLERDGS